MQKILITGASGFVGGFLVEEALNKGLEVYAAVRKTSDISYLKDSRIQFVYIDFEDKEALRQLFINLKFDYIIHNAGLTKSLRKADYFKVNADYLKNLLDAISISDAQPKKFTFVSSLAAYGPADYSADGIVTEKGKPHPVTSYGSSKLAGESYLKQQTDLPYVIIRPTAVYGPREKDLLTVYQLINKGLEMTVGLQDQKLTFIYVKDLVRVILDSTLADKKNVAYFVTDLTVQTSTSYNKAIKKALGNKKALRIKLPIVLVKIIGAVSEVYGKISGTHPALNMEKVNELQAKSWVCDTEPMISDLDFSPDYNLARGLSETIEWCKNNNWLK